MASVLSIEYTYDMLSFMYQKGSEVLSMTELVQEILKWKKERDAVILAHYYVDSSVQAIADYVGDSYFLSKMASQVEQQTIILCGVLFMGESAKIMNPGKTIIMPDLSADCPMAHMVVESEILHMRELYEDLAVVCYINSTAEIKALSDVCVTSSNALRIVKALPQSNIFFVPDRNLGHYIASQLPEKNFLLNDGFCPVHDRMTPADIRKVKALHPDAEIIVHPECVPDVVDMADFVGSTTGMIDYATKSESSSFIVCTEEGVAYELEQKNPGKSFYFPEPIPICPNMKRITLEKILHVLKTMENKVELDEDVRLKAEHALIRMHEIAK
jgi:quinolinate synthase